MRYFRSIGVLGTLLLSFALCLRGQTVTATLLGTVSDISGGVIANAKVTP